MPDFQSVVFSSKDPSSGLSIEFSDRSLIGNPALTGLFRPRPNDPWWNYVTAILHFDGTHGQNSGFVDSGPNELNVNNSGSIMAYTTAAPKFGTSNLNTGSAGTTTQHVYVGQPHNFYIGDKQDFTIEFWHKKSANTYDSYFNTVGNGSPVNTHNGFVYITPISPAAYYFDYLVNNASKCPMQIATASAYDNTWHFVAICRSGSGANCLKMYLDGAAGAQSSYTGAMSHSFGLNFGGGYYSTTAVNTQMDEVRFTTGIARYSGSFTVPNAAFPSY